MQRSRSADDLYVEVYLDRMEEKRSKAEVQAERKKMKR
jgi:hypothetical protein